MANGQSYYQMTANAPSAWDSVLPGLKQGMERARKQREETRMESTLKMQREKLTEALKEIKEQKDLRKEKLI